MSTLTVENNRITDGSRAEMEFTSVGYLHARRNAEIARAEALTQVFGAMFANRDDTADRHNTETVDMSRFAHLSRHEQARIERAMEVGESIAAAIAGVERFVRNAIVGPISRYAKRQQLVTELSDLSNRTLADIGMRRIDIPTVTQDAYPIYTAENGMEGSAANDDDARRHVA